MPYVDAFLQHATWFSLIGIAVILFLLRLKHVKFGRGTAFFEMAFGRSEAEQPTRHAQTVAEDIAAPQP